MNMVEYSEYRLGLLCKRFSSGKGISADLINETGKYPVIGGNGLRGYTDTYNFDGECAVIGRQGAYCGNVQFFSGKGYMTEHAVVTQPNSANNAKYLTYKLSGLSLGRFSGQAAQPGLSVTKLARLRIEMPPKWYQDRVAGILSAYDNLIEVNNKRIDFLEQIAENLYKEWFVRFRFPGHETAEFENGIPEGWAYRRADEVIDFNPTLKTGNQTEFTIIPMEALSTNSMVLDSGCFVRQDSISGRRSQNGDTLLAKITPCLENGKTGFVMGMPENEVLGGSTEFVVMRSKALTPHYVYCIARSYYFRQTAILSMNGADGRQRVDEDKLKSTKILQPEKTVLDHFETIVTPIFDGVYQMVQENKNLIQQRDLLLPRLMSGKLEV